MMSEERRGLLRGGLGDVLMGAGMAAVGGANPLLGLLLAPSLKRDREQRALENERQRQLIQAQDDLVEFMGKSERVQAPANLVGIEDPTSSMSTMYRAPGKMSNVPSYTTPQGQQELMGILARMDPAAAVKAALPNRERTNALQQKIDAATQLGMSRGLRGEELNEFVDSLLITPKSQAELALEALLLKEKRQSTEAAAEEAEQEREEREKEEASFRSELQTAGDNLMELAQVTERMMDREGLPGFLSRPGIPVADLRRAAASLYDDEAAFDIGRFDSLTSQITLNRMDTEGFDPRNQRMFESFTATKPTFEGFVGKANLATVRDNLKGVLIANEAGNGGLSPNLVRKYQREVDRLTGIVGVGNTEGRDVILPDGTIMEGVPWGVSDEDVIRDYERRGR